MCILGIVGRPGVSWGAYSDSDSVLGCPGVIRLTAYGMIFMERVLHQHRLHVLHFDTF